MNLSTFLDSTALDFRLLLARTTKSAPYPSSLDDREKIHVGLVRDIDRTSHGPYLVRCVHNVVFAIGNGIVYERGYAAQV